MRGLFRPPGGTKSLSANTPERLTVIPVRVRYSETDQMGTFYNSRVLEWFECGRTEWLRTRGVPYAEMEERGFFLPIVESHVKYHGRARYDDLLAVATSADFIGRARVRFDVTVSHEAEGSPVASG